MGTDFRLCCYLINIKCQLISYTLIQWSKHQLPYFHIVLNTLGHFTSVQRNACAENKHMHTQIEIST